MNGTWKTGFYYGNLKDGFVGPRAVRPEGQREDEGGDRGEESGARSSGTFYEFAGPLYDQKRQAARPEGQEADASSSSTR